MPDTLDDPNKVTVTVNTDPTMPLNTYFQLFEQMADPVLLIKDDKFINCNQASLNELGYFDKATFLNLSPWDISPEFQADGMASKEKALTLITIAQQQGYLRFEWLHQCYDETLINVEVTLTAINVLNECLLHVVWRNNTAKAVQLKQLKVASALEVAIHQSTFFSSIATDVNGVIQIFNVGAETMLGYEAHNVVNIMTPADLSDAVELIARADALSLEYGKTITAGFEALIYKAKQGIEDIYELTYLCKDGRRLPAIVSVTSLRNEQHKVIGYLLIGTDNTVRKLAEQSMGLTSTAFYSAQGMFITDAQGMITLVNQAFVDTSGYSKAELVGQNPRLLKSDIHEADFYEILWESITQKGFWTGEIWNKRKNGDIYCEKMSVIKVVDEQNNDVSYVANFYDITQLKAYEKGLIEAKDKAERFSTLKSQFMATMSHEIRTPMAAIIGFSELALYEEMSEPVRTYLQDINKASSSLLTILQDILDFSKLEVGRIVIEAEAFNLNELLDTISILFMGAANQKGLTFSIASDSAIPVELVGDKNRLQQVLTNLVGNAIKFTTQGSVKLKVSLQKIDLSYVRLLFTVTDTGIGIAIDDQDKLFQVFTQLDGSHTRKHGGCGLGLAISKELVELMGGDIAVDSRQGKGSVFSFVLVLDMVKNAIEHTTNLRLLAPNVKNIARQLALKGAAVLVVEDNVMTQTLVRQHLNHLGIDAKIAQHGEEALSMVEQYDFDIILMDIHMPVMNGIEATRRIHQQEKFAKLPIIALSAGVTESERNNCIACGMVGFISKPIDSEQLYSVLELWLKPHDIQ
jgi:PAS domain S-box-containing protein